jgi:Cu+-exporting ATPase
VQRQLQVTAVACQFIFILPMHACLFLLLQFWIGWRFQKGAWKALRRGVANMDVLVALGTDASYFYSVISILHHRFVQHDAMHYVPTVRQEEGCCGGGIGAGRWQLPGAAVCMHAVATHDMGVRAPAASRLCRCCCYAVVQYRTTGFDTVMAWVVVLALQDFFETCAMLITVVILGKYMECQAKGKTSEAIQVRNCLLTHNSTSHVWCVPVRPCSTVLVLMPRYLQAGGGHA